MERPTLRPPRPAALTTAAFWNQRHGETPRRYVWPRPGWYFLDAEIARTFRRHVPSLAPGPFLEIGCGGSVWMPYLQKVHGLEVWGVDYSAEGIARARRLLELHGAKAEAHLADAFALGPEWTARFAGVFSQGLVEHFADPGDVLERFAGLVRPGGLLITWVPHTAGWVVRLSTAISPALRSVYAPLDLPRLVAWQQAAGLTMVEARYTQFLDLTLVNLVGFPRLVRRGFALSGRLLSLPLVWLCNVAGWSPQDRRLCSGMITVARKPGA